MYLFVGTAKGLFRYQSDNRTVWRGLGAVLEGQPVYTSAYNTDNKVLYAGVNNEFYGASVRRSQDWGESWDTGGSGLEYAADDEERVTRVWSIRPVDKNLVYAGVEASGLFKSTDGGENWEEVKALRQHPTHETWGPGYGGKCLHTIGVDRFDNRLYIACSSGGIYRSNDGGENWSPINAGIRAEFMPEDQQYPESGQCVHKFWLSPSHKGLIWLQNHGGVYRSDDGGDTWVYVGAELPSDFGFPIVGHPTDRNRAYVLPVQREGRWSPDNVLAVYGTSDGGRQWERLNNGLPESSFTGVLRDAFTSDNRGELGLYFGTTSGEVYSSADEGQSWHLVAQHLPRIYSVVAVDEP